VRNLNIMIQSFPNVLIARPLGFTEAEFFEADDAASATPRVTFERAAP
jgi:LemA protein